MGLIIKSMCSMKEGTDFAEQTLGQYQGVNNIYEA